MNANVVRRRARLKVGAAAPEVTVLDADGRPQPLSAAWQAGPVVLSFLRHFGWLFCREWLAQLEQHQSEIRAAGLSVVAVGLGKPRHAQRYCSRLAPSLTCLVGRGAEAHLAYGLRHGGPAELMSPGVVLAGARAVLGGYLQGKATGPQDILGATFVVDAAGMIRAAYYDRFAGDHADLKALLASYLQ